tara:strand:+ start:260 stop:1372 length:1113 start_codon:yes stop_codon:yes gene_type:complete
MKKNEANKLFENLFVLEIANNHWGDLKRGKKIISEYGKVVRYNNVKAAMKLQFRDVPNFVHKDFKGREDLRYIWKTEKTQLKKDQHAVLIEAIKKAGCIPMATAFDERAVEWCVELGIGIIKVASSDINDWFLLQKIARTKKPVILSTGGASLKSIDDVVRFFANRNIPIALNHCVSNYPSEDCELELNQIDFLRARYPDIVIGLSTHEYHDWSSSMMLSYAKGARTWERHVDIEYPEGDERSVSKYCSLPHQADEWFKAFHKAKEMCGGSKIERRVISEKETKYLDALVRGVYFKKNLSKGHVVTTDDVYLAIPLQEGQISPREFMEGEKLLRDCKRDEPMVIQDIDSTYKNDSDTQSRITKRGLRCVK